MTRYFDDSEEDGFASVRGLLTRNRSYLIDRLRDHQLLDYITPDVGVSVAWLKIKNPAPVLATTLQRTLAEDGVYVLPGTYFYWNAPVQGERFMRVALARDSERFEASVDRMLDVLSR